jgi:two-component system NtrC family sensor kinase
MHQTEKLAALGELVAGVAHELNNPLTGISTFAQLLLEDELGDEQRDSVLTIKREADRAVSVIRDLLVFSRKTGPRMVPIDLNALVHQTLRLRAYSLQSTGVEVRTELEAQLPTILGDDQKLQQVLLNLVVNAEYAMQRSETRILTIRTRPGGRDVGREVQVVLEVVDTGIGMASEVMKHVFEPFFTTKPAGVGTGLGLSVSYGIIQAHGGTITVTSAPGAGATFTATLPMRSASQIPERATASRSAAAASALSKPAASAAPSSARHAD